MPRPTRTSADFGGIGDANAVSGQRSDTIMILRQEQDGNGVVAAEPAARPVGQHRRTRQRQNRINSAYSDGTDVLAATITQEFGIPIHHVVEVDFEGFKDIIDSAGGTEMCFWYVTRDKNTGLDQQPGCHIARRPAGPAVRPQPPLRGVPRRAVAGGSAQ